MLSSVFSFIFAGMLLTNTSSCDIEPISEGFGAHGQFSVLIDSIQNPAWPSGNVYLYAPKMIDSTPYPAIFFLHGLGAFDHRTYGELLTHMASKGYVIIYPMYKQLFFDFKQTIKYDIILQGAESALKKWQNLIDISRIGFVGHSFGGGAVPSIAWNFLINNSWGKQGAFLFIMAPWYFYDIDQEQLENFPSHTKMIMQVYEHDRINDHRMAIDIFNNLDIPEMNKNFVFVQSDNHANCKMIADHTLPTGNFTQEGKENGLDYYAVYRLFDALALYTFQNDSTAREIALGNGNKKQTYMGIWPDSTPVKNMLVNTDSIPIKKQLRFINFWEHRINPRIGYCEIDSTYPDSPQRYINFRTIRNYFKVGQHFYKTGRKNLAALKKPNGPIPPASKGYGSTGIFSVLQDSIPNPEWKNHFVYFYRPSEMTSPAPVILFSHGYSKTSPLVYWPFIKHIVQKGYCVIFSPYRPLAFKTEDGELYKILQSGFISAMKHFSQYVDTTKMGFFGHSFGAGATPALVLLAVNEYGWANKAAFMFMTAPWYTFGITLQQLKTFPEHVKLIIQVYEHDKINDGRIGIDLFNNINIPRSEKCFIVLPSDTVSGYAYTADHYVPKGPWDPAGEEDALDYYGLYRIFDALSAYTFNNDTIAKYVALGRQDTEMRKFCEKPECKKMKPILLTKTPTHSIIHQDALFMWNSRFNPLKVMEE